ncbi:MAG: class I SAM-dependent methyltransferase [Haloarculaceae archaeon]
MGFHTFDPAGAERLEDPSRYEYLSVEELLALFEASTEDVVLDLGSGTGFFTDDVAPHVRRIHAVDVQPEMHAFYKDKGVPENVDLVTAEVADLPFDDGQVDAAYSTMTFHEFATPEALGEVGRVLGPGGRLGIADWSASGEGGEGPPTSERYDADRATALLEDAGFEVKSGADRRETFVVSATMTR